MLRILRLLVGALLLVIAVALIARTYMAVTDDRLAVWHRYAPFEPTADEIDTMDWAAWRAAEDKAFAEVHENVTLKLDDDQKVPENRYWEGSPMYSPGFATDWNRSFTLMPEGKPVGAVVLLHGLTDSPYSLRHVGAFYQSRGYAVVAPRMPGHGTVPGGLERANWHEWIAATRLAVREAEALAGPDVPLDLVGYSNGGALAMVYAMDALEIPALRDPDRIILISPMIGVTWFARFAGLAGWPAIFPAFDRAAWFDLLPEYNPFKYNSFPVNGGRQSYLLTEEVQGRLRKLAGNGGLQALAPVLAFQSIQDSTVSTSSVVTELFDRLPAKGSELVLYDVNRSAVLSPLLRPRVLAEADRLLPPGPRNYATVLVGNGASGTVERVTAPDGTVSEVPLGMDYPRDIFSLSHIALPFPPSDGLYGTAPDPAENFGINLGTMTGRGESGSLVISLDMVGRLSSNPFFPEMLNRIGAFIAPDLPPA